MTARLRVHGKRYGTIGIYRVIFCVICDKRAFVSKIMRKVEEADADVSLRVKMAFVRDTMSSSRRNLVLENSNA